MLTLEQIREAEKQHIILEKARIRARTLLSCLAFRQDPASPRCNIKGCEPWQIAACSELQKMIARYINLWLPEVEQIMKEEQEKKRGSDKNVLE